MALLNELVQPHIKKFVQLPLEFFVILIHHRVHKEIFVGLGIHRLFPEINDYLHIGIRDDIAVVDAIVGKSDSRCSMTGS